MICKARRAHRPAEVEIVFQNVHHFRHLTEDESLVPVVAQHLEHAVEDLCRVCVVCVFAWVYVCVHVLVRVGVNEV